MVEAIKETTSGERSSGRIAMRRFEEMDWDKNGMVNFKEFLFAYTRWKQVRTTGTLVSVPVLVHPPTVSDDDAAMPVARETAVCFYSLKFSHTSSTTRALTPWFWPFSCRGCCSGMERPSQTLENPPREEYRLALLALAAVVSCRNPGIRPEIKMVRRCKGKNGGITIGLSRSSSISRACIKRASMISTADELTSQLSTFAIPEKLNDVIIRTSDWNRDDHTFTSAPPFEYIPPEARGLACSSPL
ncbi:hypothetical protein F8388_024385 [Cannabis sativa]|uniref:EF-hand domain-containing protein n=1 Tax=Cannabis sativa TaxID=3483 RepID=A0A7J6DSQ2_CANSA|nr:hypothetical protein G4B88_031239 [Cannabis sativa]KAF4349117.1 hypothetical protein F8388_024385 [Cannabis sativa]